MTPVHRLCALVLCLLVLPAALPAQEIVQGFHGYAWGTPREAILEIAGTGQVGERDGLPIWSAGVSVLGRDALAGFYFHPDTGGLVEGAYVFALDLERCERTWDALLRDVERDHPGLVREDRWPAPEATVRAVYDSDCEYFVFNAHREEWTTILRNSAGPGDEVWMWMRAIERKPRLTVLYRGAEGRAWADAHEGRGPGGG